MLWFKHQSSTLANFLLHRMALPPQPQNADDENDALGEEKPDSAKSMYFVTFSHPKSERAADGTRLRSPSSYTQKQVIEAMLDAVAKTQGPRLATLRLKLMADFREKHQDGHAHDHVAVLAEKCFRFAPLKKVLLRDYGLASHWSCSHVCYADMIAYGYLPSERKPSSELDPHPELWAAEGQHPPLAEASRRPQTAAALAQRREKNRLKNAEKEKPEPKFEDIDVWPVVIRENIHDVPGAAEVLMGYAKRCGGPLMVKFCFRNWQKLPELISRSWKVEKVEDYIEQAGKSRVQLLQEASCVACTCGGNWLAMARELFERNNLSEEAWREAMMHSITHGRGKGTLVCHAGHVGNEGKSFLFAPLELVFGESGVFNTPPKGGFPLMGLESSRVVLLDDWRFNEDLVSYPLQLLWFEGKPIVIARPQNQFSGHLKYSGDAPVFISTLMADIHKVKGKNIEGGDVAMMVKRLRIFEFSQVLESPVKVKPCARCFATLLLGQHEALDGSTTAPVLPLSQNASPLSQNASTQKRNLPSSAALPPTSKKLCKEWSILDVQQYLHSLGLSHVCSLFESNAVDGEMLCTLTDQELQSELGLTMLQAKKILSRLAS